MKNSRVKLLAAAAALVLTLLTACGTGSNSGVVTDAPVLTDRPATQAPAVTDEPVITDAPVVTDVPAPTNVPATDVPATESGTFITTGDPEADNGIHAAYESLYPDLYADVPENIV